ncbi:hypothetical protein GE09DRAFT_1065063 [Coniochaeta sp. 2T2.1]|nr:hypothetical protein GE09DRAFT_1065063 [Coniochaeta sp. 2T2.1]
MANVSLDAPTAANPEPRSQNFYAGNGKTSAGASQDDALLISSDNESDYGHFEDDQSDTFPSIGELPLPSRHQDDQRFSATSSASGDSDTKESSVTDGADSDNETVSSWQQQRRGLEHPPAAPSTLAPLRPWFASPEPFQAKHDQLAQSIPVGNPLCGAGLASDPKDTTYRKRADGISHGFGAQHSHSLRLSGSPSPWSRLLQTDQDPPDRVGNALCEGSQIPDSDDTTRDVLVRETPGATTLRHVVEQSPSSSRETTPYLEGEEEPSPDPQWEESPPRENTPCLDAASHSDDLGGQNIQQSGTHLGGASDEGAGPPKAIRESTRTGRTVCRTHFPDRPRDTYLDDDNWGQKSDHHGYARDDKDAEEAYRPTSLEGSEREWDEEDDFGPPPSKRRKTVSAVPTTLNTAATQRLRSSGSVSQSRKVQSTALGRKRSSRRSIPCPTSSRASHDGKGAVGAVFASFEEWPLENVSLKRVTENGMTTFQLQFSWDSCEHATESPRSESPVKKRKSTKRGHAARAAITPDEDDLVIKLKEVDKLRWQEIHKRFTEAFPGRKRSVATLQADAPEFVSTSVGILHTGLDVRKIYRTAAIIDWRLLGLE